MLLRAVSTSTRFPSPPERFQGRMVRSEADERYRALAAAAGEALRQATRQRLKAQAPLTQPLRRLRVLERTLRLERRRDWFRAPGWTEAEAAIRSAIQRLESLRDRPPKGAGHALDH